MHEYELGAPEHVRRREDQGSERAEAGRDAADAARALNAGRPEAVRPAAMLHLQRAAGNAGIAQLLGDEQQAESPVKDVIGRGGGEPLDAGIRQRMESSFGADLSDVRVHAGGEAASSAQAVDAHAYTVGNEVVLGSGHEPGSPSHERTMAHELTHVLQQRSGPVDGTEAPGGIRLSSPGDPFERAAEATADMVMGGGAPGPATTGAAPAAQALATQRQEEGPSDEPEQEEEAPEAQALAIQRQAGDENEIQEEDRIML
jgi:hypothetical protein